MNAGLTVEVKKQDGTVVTPDANGVITLAADETVNVRVLGTTGDVGNGKVATVRLNAQAVTAAGVPLQTSATNSKQGAADVVLADAARADGNVAGDGESFATATYTVQAGAVAVEKSSKVTHDGLGDTSANAKAIPGATIPYCIKVINPADGATASGVTANDTVPAQLTIQSGTFRINNKGLCEIGTPADLTTATNAPVAPYNVSVPWGSIAPNKTIALLFDTTAN